MTTKTFDQRITDIEEKLKVKLAGTKYIKDAGLLAMIETAFHSNTATDMQKRRLNAICTDFIFNCLAKSFPNINNTGLHASDMVCGIMKIIFVEKNIPLLPEKTRPDLENIMFDFYTGISQNDIYLTPNPSDTKEHNIKHLFETFALLKDFMAAPEPGKPPRSAEPLYDASKIQVNGGRKIVFNDAANDQGAAEAPAPAQPSRPVP